MILTRTPLRISFCGGGTDLPEFYNKFEGSVISSTIQKYLFITLNKKFDNKIRAIYSKEEFVDNVSDLTHPLIRESLIKENISKGVEICSMSDIPTRGSGLGSSSTFTVGLLHALKKYNGKSISPAILAEDACDIEINKCNQPIGKQDQYAASFGGLNYIKFTKDKIIVKKININKDFVNEIEDSLFLVYTGILRNASNILEPIKDQLKDENNNTILKEMNEITSMFKDELEKENIDFFSEALNLNWNIKKKLSKNISSEKIDSLYNFGIKSGALSGKLLGAGGGGFVLFFVSKTNKARFIESFSNHTLLSVKFDYSGSKICYESKL